MSETVDVVIVGGGIAGVSAGYHLAAAGTNLHLVEAEATLAYHTTGRSAAQYVENLGSAVTRRLTIAGRRFFTDPPAEADGPLWASRPVLAVGGPAMVDQLRHEAETARTLTPSTRFVDAAEAHRLCPVLRPDMVAGGLLEPDAKELDVAAIHQTFVRGIRESGGRITTGSRVTGLDQTDSGWRVTAGDLVIDTPVVVNAAGAWCDRVGVLAGVSPLGLRPLRRTACILAVPPELDRSDWPMVAFNGHSDAMQGYMKSEPGGLMVSPADEIPSEPCDAKPDETDVARGLDAVARWTTLDTSHVHSTWAGLRSFVADRNLVAGFATDGQGFFWLTGQGGYGIQTSPSLGLATCGLVVEGALPDELLAAGITEADLAANRPGLEGDLVDAH